MSTSTTFYANDTVLQEAMEDLKNNWDDEQEVFMAQTINKFADRDFRNKPNKNRNLHRALIEFKRYGN
jgi:hypothetical protein